MNHANGIQHLKRSNINYICMQNSQEVWRPQKAQATTRIKEINIAKLPTQNNKQQTKQRANIEKGKTSTIIVTTQPMATTSGLQQQQQLLNFSDSNSERLSNISEENLCCVCKNLSLDALHLLYTFEFVTQGKCDRCNH